MRSCAGAGTRACACRGGRGAVRGAGGLCRRHGGEARRLDRHRLAAGESREVVGRRDRGARRRPCRVVELGDERVVEGAGQPRRVLLRQEAEVEREAGRQRSAAGLRGLLNGICRTVRSSAPDRARSHAATVVDVWERRRWSAIGRVASPVESTRNVVPSRGSGDRPLAASPVPTGLPLGGTDRILSRRCRRPPRSDQREIRGIGRRLTAAARRRLRAVRDRRDRRARRRGRDGQQGGRDEPGTRDDSPPGALAH